MLPLCRASTPTRHMDAWRQLQSSKSQHWAQLLQSLSSLSSGSIKPRGSKVQNQECLPNSILNGNSLCIYIICKYTYTYTDKTPRVLLLLGTLGIGRVRSLQSLMLKASTTSLGPGACACCPTTLRGSSRCSQNCLVE